MLFNNLGFFFPHKTLVGGYVLVYFCLLNPLFGCREDREKKMKRLHSDIYWFGFQAKTDKLKIQTQLREVGSVDCGLFCSVINPISILMYIGYWTLCLAAGKMGEKKRKFVLWLLLFWI